MMGNCIRKESSTQWGGEDWSSFGEKGINRRNSHRENSINDAYEEGKSSLVGDKVLSRGTEMKIKVSKKQLEQLLKNADVQEISVEQVLARLTDGGDRAEEAHERPWRPALHTIPE